MGLDRVSRRNPTNVYHKMPRDEVKKLMPNFNMSQYLERAEAPPGESANVSEPDFLKGVDKVIADNPLPDLQTYLRWHVLHSNAAMLPRKAATASRWSWVRPSRAWSIAGWPHRTRPSRRSRRSWNPRRLK